MPTTLVMSAPSQTLKMIVELSVLIKVRLQYCLSDVLHMAHAEIPKLYARSREL